jgi:hypothetical protein
MLNRTTTLIVLLALVLALGGLGCSAEPESTPPAPAAGETGAQDTSSEEAPAEAPDFSYLTGAWTVTTELTGIDNAAMTPAADRPGAQWECVVVGDTMQLNTDRHEYTGLLTPEADGGWLYEASATFTDEDGYTVTSTIEVHAKPTNTDLDSFAGYMTGTIDTDDGHLYTATWDLEGTRQ